MDSTPDAFRRFARAAEEYDALVQVPPDGRERTEFIWALRAALAELLAAALRLPAVEPSEDDVPASLGHDQWKDAFTRLQAHVGVLDAESETSIAVADDLADIWRDLRNGLNALSAGSPWQDVCWQWRFGLQTHWGRHATHALAALHDA